MKVLQVVILFGAVSMFGAAHAQEIPDSVIDGIETQVRAAVVADVNGRLSGKVGLVNATEWTVDFQAEIAFPQLPQVRCYEGPAPETARADQLWADAVPCIQAFFAVSQDFTMIATLPVDTSLDARVKVDFPVLKDADGSVKVRKRINTFVLLPFVRNGVLGFGVRANFDEAQVALTAGSGNVDIGGLTGELVTLSTIAGGVALGPLGLTLGPLVGWISADDVEDAVANAIEKKLNRQINSVQQNIGQGMEQALSDQGDAVVGTTSALLMVVVN